ncbi:hypothetical protein AXF42_Ash009916 [Apostasia shenzhenica]|uniref:Uncharacterized protein n=1 Tax=Apostasia shenzhenica TaxID=1088818 RepID=A0A2I0ACD8_9ASPA|nr:hypothetical protein AXF42_Ash009916 [Apostasia shenzhenica]
MFCRKGARISGSRRQGERTNAEGGEAGQEEEAEGKGSQADAVQPPIRYGRCWLWEEEGTQLVREINAGI